MAEAIGAIAAVSAVSSILQVIDFTLSVSKQTYRLIKGSEDALRENIEVERLTRDYKLISEQICSSQAKINGLNRLEAASLKKANECRREAAVLLEMLDDLKVETRIRGGRRLLHVAGKSAKAVRLRSKIESRITHLDKLNGQLAILLVQLLGENQAASFDSLVARVQLTDDKAAARVKEARDTILSTIEQARTADSRNLDGQAPCITEHESNQVSSNTASKGYPDLDSMSKKSKKIADRVIESLRFPEINHRRDAVQSAHRLTFEWILEEKSSPFMRWLESNDRVFWITGKAGSGKSTLMKYLSSHHSTTRLAGATSNNRDKSRQACLLDYYFWYSGTLMQKSLTGLLRSLLYQILKHCPHAIPTVCSRRFEATESFHGSPDSWSDQELRDTLSLVAKENLSVDFYIFVDGLDEFEGDHQDLVELLQQLAENPQLFLCVSSRPWNVFDRAFGDGRHWFRLEHLTRHDIKSYVTDKLQSLPKTPSFTALVNEIIEKAQGVFLWVFLVVRTLREGFLEGDDVALLQRRLRAMPSDLEEYFDKILSRIDGVYSSQTAQLLKLAMLLAGYGRKDHHLNSFLCFWLICRGVENSDFAFSRSIQYCSSADFEDFAKETQRSLSARCKDLLYFHFDKDAHRDITYDFQDLKVDFLHRTVYEFLQTNVMEKVDSQLPLSFADPDFLRLLTLAHLKLVPTNTRVLENYHKAIQGNLEQVSGTSLEKHFSDVSLHYYLRWASRNCNCFQSSSDCIRYVEAVVCESVDVRHGTPTHPWPLLVPSLGLLPQHCFDTTAINVRSLSVLISKGADPNQYVDCLQGTIWHSFLRKRMTELAEMNATRTTCQSWSSDPYVQHCRKIANLWRVIKVLIEAGADTETSVDCYGLCSALSELDDQPPTNNIQHCYHQPQSLVARMTTTIDGFWDFADALRIFSDSQTIVADSQSIFKTAMESGLPSVEPF